MKRNIIILLFLILFTHVCMAESFFPSTNELFGQVMPSISSVTGKEANAEEKTEDGTKYTYNGFSTQDYTAFSKYLAKQGCSVDQVTVNNKVLVVIITKDNSSITFTYDFPCRVASMLYPANTRKEDASDSLLYSDSEVEVLPDVNKTFGTALPSLNLICNKEPEIMLLDNYKTQYSYTNVTEKQYNDFSCYLAEKGCELIKSDFNGTVLKATIRYDGASFNIEYNNSAYTVNIIYPELYYIDDKEYDGTSTALIPTTSELFGEMMPRIDIATGLSAESKTYLEDGGYEETYLGFTDTQYNKFSGYLKEYGCTISEYWEDENGVLHFILMRNDVPFTFIYDRAVNQATIRYAAGTRPEPTLTPTPTLEPKPVPTPNSDNTKFYSESDCWKTAERYFKNLRWKNPSSLTIHGHTSSYSNDEYTFVIDYSAQNGFGGYNRKSAIICVSNKTNSITTAWVE